VISSLVILALDVALGLIIYRVAYALNQGEHIIKNSGLRIVLILLIVPVLIVIAVLVLIMFAIETLSFERPDTDL
jgi:heme/copper-type cytochrome/quinol oxidase subunit 2